MHGDRKPLLWPLTMDDKDMMVRIVSECRQSGLSGTLGDWKAYLQEVESPVKKPDSQLHTWQVLADFIEALPPKGLKVARRHMRWERQLRTEPDSGATGNRGGQASTATGQEGWWALIQRTAAHPKYKDLYTLPSYGKGWVRFRSSQLDPTASLVPLALDCEMCATASDARALVGLCVVDAAGNTLLQEHVKPKRRVIDYRTAITGLSMGDLEGVAFTRRDAQKQLLALLARGNVVLVGHAVHHDLAALRLDAAPVIDTALLFSYRGLKHYTPALADLAALVLGRCLRAAGAPHACADDARAALALAQAAAVAGGPVAPLAPPDSKVSWEDLRKLLVHGLNPNTPVLAVRAMFPADAPAPCGVERVLGKRGALLLVYAHPGDANSAFRLLQGAAELDCRGRPQKRITLQKGGSPSEGPGQMIRVRKMGAHNGASFGKDARRRSQQRRKRKREPAT